MHLEISKIAENHNTSEGTEEIATKPHSDTLSEKHMESMDHSDSTEHTDGLIQHHTHDTRNQF